MASEVGRRMQSLFQISSPVRLGVGGTQGGGSRPPPEARATVVPTLTS